MPKRRTSGGGVQAWNEALFFLRRNWAQVAQAAAVLLSASVIINLVPGTPDWLAGFLTGFLLASLAGFAWWLAWVPSGLAARSMGLVGETWTSELLRAAQGVHAVIPSLKFEGRDVDHVVIAAAGIVAVEAKWTARPPSKAKVEGTAYAAALVGRSLRNNLKRKELPEELFSSVVLYWGPGGSQITSGVVQTPHGAVPVMAGEESDAWLESLRKGPVGPDYAEALAREVESIAVMRDRNASKAGWLVRWLAKAK